MTYKNEAPANSTKSAEANTNDLHKNNSLLFDFQNDNQPIRENYSENNSDSIGIKQVSVFKDFSKLIENVELSSIIHDIQNGRYKSEVEDIRAALSENNQYDADRLKKKLIGFTPSGTFNNGRKIKDITTYSGCIILDIDKLTPEQLTTAKETAVSIPYTYAAFVSPSGKGLKIIVTIDQGREQHAAAMAQITNYYFKKLNLPIDPSGKDVSRLCFVSYDPDCYFNPKPEIFKANSSLEFKQKHQLVKKVSIQVEDNPDQLFDDCVKFTERKSTYHIGNRNNFIHQLACNCNRKGIPFDTALSYIRQSYDLDDTELTKAVESAYNNNPNDFANSANFASSAVSKSDELSSKEAVMSNMPYLPDDIFNSLPALLKDGCKVFTNKRERDVFLTGALSIFSGCMPNVVGVYMRKEVYANLYTFTVAPAASGKGALTFSKELGQKYHEKLLQFSNDQRKIYNMKMEEYKKNSFSKNTEKESIEMPVEPPFKVLYIPGNNSSARVIQHLKESDGQGIFCETEADTIGNVFKQDWGSYSDLLRKAFHHEPISYSRKKDKEFVEIKKPRLAVALAGTPGQVEGLIKSAEDGLFSRFLFYVFRSEIEWMDASDTAGGYNLTTHFEALSILVLRFVEFLNYTDKIHFNLTGNQWTKLNEFGNSSISKLTTLISEEMASTSKRLGLILYRIAMIISALRYYDNGEVPIHMTCSDDDFDIALKLINTYQEHAAFMFGQLPKSPGVADKTLKKFFDLLPDEFLRKDAVAIALTINIKERTADGYLSKLVSSKLLEQDKLGHYTKVKK